MISRMAHGVSSQLQTLHTTPRRCVGMPRSCEVQNLEPIRPVVKTETANSSVSIGKFFSRHRHAIKRKRQALINADAWRPPIVVEDIDILKSPKELGSRYARIALCEQPIKRLRTDSQQPGEAFTSIICFPDMLNQRQEGLR